MGKDFGVDFQLDGHLTQTIQEAGNSGSLPGNTGEYLHGNILHVGSWGYWNTNQGQSNTQHKFNNIL